MKRRTLTFCFLGAAAAAVLLTVSLDRSVQAQTQIQSQGATLAGTWFIGGNEPDLTAFINYHQDGTMDGIRSHELGGPPRPGEFRSTLRGVWRRMGNGFEAVTFGYRYNRVTGDAVAIVRLRWVFSFDPGFESTSGHHFVAQWFCPTPLTCPNPQNTVPDIPESFIGLFTQTRMRPL